MSGMRYRWQWRWNIAEGIWEAGEGRWWAEAGIADCGWGFWRVGLDGSELGEGLCGAHDARATAERQARILPWTFLGGVCLIVAKLAFWACAVKGLVTWLGLGG